MKQLFKRMIAIVCIVASVFVFASCNNKNKTKVVEIIVDGGGQNAMFNSTRSMIYDKDANPYPYNTLEKLGEEWSELNPGYKIKVATTSINNDRETMVPALNQGTAPHILFYLGTTIAEDMSKGWFVELNDYLEQPNKYSKPGEAGSEKWKDIYDAANAAGLAPNGKKYTIEMELNPIGIIYNKTLFEQAGITEEPETFSEFMQAQDKVNAYAKTLGRDNPTAEDYIAPYFPYYPWYDSFLETTLYGEYLEYYDVIMKDGLVTAEEIARAYMTKDSEGNRLYAPNDARAVEKARIIKVLTKYYPTAFESFYAEQQFTQGNLAMMEVLGGTTRKLVDTVGDKFEIGVFSYPVLEQRPEGMSESDPTYDYYTSYNVDKHVRRGLSGYSTGWAVTNTAINQGDEVVEKCIDFLQFVSCYENNDRMINDKGFSIPLSGNTTYPYFTKLAADYKADGNGDDILAWAAITPSANVNKTYYDAVYLNRIEIIKATDQATVNQKLNGLNTALAQALNTLYTQNKWDKNSWPAYNGPVIY